MRTFFYLDWAGSGNWICYILDFVVENWIVLGELPRVLMWRIEYLVGDEYLQKVHFVGESTGGIFAEALTVKHGDRLLVYLLQDSGRLRLHKTWGHLPTLPNISNYI